MVKLTEAMRSLTSRTVLLLGDFILDHYTIGKVKRISPEAPVPVLNVEEQFNRPGGAGNALLNLISLFSAVALFLLCQTLSFQGRLTSRPQPVQMKIFGFLTRPISTLEWHAQAMTFGCICQGLVQLMRHQQAVLPLQ